MTTWHRSVLAALASLVCLALLSVSPRLLTARDAPGRTVQFPIVELEPAVVVCPADPPPPVVSLRVRVPACATAGQELEYRICVENVSKAAAHHVLVRNPIPANAKLVRTRPEADIVKNDVLWALGTLEPGACCDLVLVLCPTGAGDLKNCARVQFEHGQCVTSHLVSPKLTLKKCGPAEAMLNDTIKFELCVCNTGDAVATAVTLTDDLPEGLIPVEGKNPLTWDWAVSLPVRRNASSTGRWRRRRVAGATRRL
jgi:uncharacterized repeat protein (TIGR01451 family)